LGPAVRFHLANLKGKNEMKFVNTLSRLYRPFFDKPAVGIPLSIATGLVALAVIVITIAPLL
jgi:hypothetical protein